MAPSKARRARQKQRERSVARARKAKQKQTASGNNSTPTVESLLSTARQLEENAQFEQAIEHFEKALQQRPQDADLQEEIASLYMQVARPDDAERAFRSAISARPDSGFEKYAYLAQLLGNTREALAHAQRGLELIRAEQSSMGDSIDEQRVEELRGFEASSHCAIAEICLGIVEDSNDAAVAAELDVEVEKSVMAALALSTEGSDLEVEATLSLANLRLSQGRREDARIGMHRVLKCMAGGLQQLEQGDGSDETVGRALESLPSLEMRIAIGKQLVEVELWFAAISTLGSVMWECDFNVEVWYLLAVAYWKLGDHGEARNALEQTRSVLKSAEGYDGELEEEMIDKLYKELGGSSEMQD